MTESVVLHTAASEPLVTLGSVVVGIDEGCDQNERALWEAALWAVRHRRDITLLTGAGRPNTHAAAASESLRQQRIKHTLSCVSHRLARSTGGSQRIRTAVIGRSAVEALIAVSLHAGLIVLQRSARSSGDPRGVDSVTSAVAAWARCPVLVVHADDQVGMRRGVLVMVDGHRSAIAGMAVGCEEATVRGVPLRVVQSQIGPRGVVHASGGGPVVLDRTTADVAEDPSACRRRLPHVRLPQSALTVGSLAKLSAIARDCELLVVSSIKPDGGRSILSPATRHVLGAAGCPVLVVPPDWSAAAMAGRDPDDDGRPAEPILGTSRDAG